MPVDLASLNEFIFALDFQNYVRYSPAVQYTYRRCMTYKAEILKLGTSFSMGISQSAKAWYYFVLLELTAG